MRNRGVTLLELLVVIVIMAVIASIVLPTIGSPRPDIHRPAQSVDEVIASSRRTAVLKGTPLHLRIDVDGVWALVGDASGEAMGGGVIERTANIARPANLQHRVMLRIDAVGACMPERSLDGSESMSAFDPIACRTVSGRYPMTSPVATR